MAVAIERRAAPSVAEALRHGGHRHTVRQHRRGDKVPQIVEPDMLQTLRLAEPIELEGHEVGTPGTDAGIVREDPPRCWERLLGCLCSLLPPVCRQLGHDARTDPDDAMPLATCLGFSDHEATCGCVHDRAADDDSSVVQVDVVPLDREHLPVSGARVGRQSQKDPQRPACRREQALNLFEARWLDLSGRQCRWPNVACRVADRPPKRNRPLSVARSDDLMHSTDPKGRPAVAGELLVQTVKHERRHIAARPVSRRCPAGAR